MRLLLDGLEHRDISHMTEITTHTGMGLFLIQYLLNINNFNHFLCINLFQEPLDYGEGL